MSDDTSTIRILNADPERVVSVTVGELQNLCKWAYGCGHDFVGMSDAKVHELHERRCATGPDSGHVENERDTHHFLMQVRFLPEAVFPEMVALIGSEYNGGRIA